MKLKMSEEKFLTNLSFMSSEGNLGICVLVCYVVFLAATCVQNVGLWGSHNNWPV